MLIYTKAISHVIGTETRYSNANYLDIEAETYGQYAHVIWSLVVMVWFSINI